LAWQEVHLGLELSDVLPIVLDRRSLISGGLWAISERVRGSTSAAAS